MSESKKVVLVTGSSRGIGYETVRVLSDRGHIVYGTMRSPTGRNAEAAQSLQALDGEIRVVELDVRNEAMAERVVSQVVERDGHLDVVVNNAGIMNVGLAEGFTIEQLAEQMNVNYLGPARLFRAALPVMRRQSDGLFVTVSSLAGRVLFPFLSTYNPSKFAIEALAEIYRYELSPFGIDSIIVQPGPFETGLIDAAPRPADAARLEAYGELGGAAEEAMAGFKKMMAGSKDHAPAVVAEDIARLIDMPYGARPLRTVSGHDYGIGRINEVSREVQRELLASMGLSSLDPESVATGA